MELSVLDVILAVLRNKFVIIVFIVIILYLSFINYIIRYKKRPKKVKPKKVVESAPSHQLVSNPKHPYTKALLSAVPSLSPNKVDRIILPGDVPSPIAPPPGCAFEPRCVYATAECKCTTPTLTAIDNNPDHQCACVMYK
jgi:oligopeptide/dipeptide ABC transporter ATP-binding protein